MADQSARGRVTDVVRSRIIHLVYPPGMPLSEKDLARELGVSRTPAREALLVLSYEGLIEVVPRVGTFVSRIDVHKVADAQFLRESVEIAALESLKLPLTPKASEALRDSLARQRQISATDDSGFFELDEEFHRLLMTVSGHGGTWAVVNRAKAHLDRARVLGYSEGTPVCVYAEQHQHVFDQLIAGNIQKAVELLREHLRMVFSDTVKAQQSVPSIFSGSLMSASGLRALAVVERRRRNITEQKQ